MFKIFFNDRCLALSDNWEAAAADANAIMHKVTKKSDIAALVNTFSVSSQMASLWLLTDHPQALMDDVRRLFVYAEAAGGLVRNAAGDVLMIFRNNRWDLPKGHREAMESLEETALREVEEECGIKGMRLFNHLTTTYHIYRDSGATVLKRTDWYAMRYNGTSTPVPQTGEAIERAEWKPVAALPAILPTVYCSIYEVFRAAELT